MFEKLEVEEDEPILHFYFRIEESLFIGNNQTVYHWLGRTDGIHLVHKKIQILLSIIGPFQHFKIIGTFFTCIIRRLISLNLWWNYCKRKMSQTFDYSWFYFENAATFFQHWLFECVINSHKWDYAYDHTNWQCLDWIVTINQREIWKKTKRPMKIIICKNSVI